MRDDALQAADVASMLGIGRNAVYALAKSGELASYRIGRKLRFTCADVERYISRSHTAVASLNLPGIDHIDQPKSDVAVAINWEALPADPFILSGGDSAADPVVHALADQGLPVARAYLGSYYALVDLYLGRADAAFVHLYDRKTNSYNAAAVQRVAPGTSVVLVRLVRRSVGLIVAAGNPKRLRFWSDLLLDNVRFVNTVRGSAARVLLDEKLVGLEARPSMLNGYNHEVAVPASVAALVAAGEADVGIGTQQLAAQTPGVDFLPMQDEWVDIAVVKTPRTQSLVRAVRNLSTNTQLKSALTAQGYDATHLGAIVYES